MSAEKLLFPYINGTATCRTDGCSLNGVEYTGEINLDFTNPLPPDIWCGECGEKKTDIVLDGDIQYKTFD